MEQAFLAHQALHEGPIAFLVLRGQAAVGVDAALGDVEAPGRREAALAVPGLEHGIDDVEHGLVLEHAAVAAQRQEGGPRFDGQLVARHAAIGAGLLEGRHVAMERAQGAAAGGGEQFDQDGLAEQGLEGDIGVTRERGQLDAAALADAFLRAQALGQQHIVAKRRGQPEQPRGLCKTVERRKEIDASALIGH